MTIKAYDGSFGDIKDLHYYDGTSFAPVKTVWRYNGSGWERVWPPDANLITGSSNINSSGWVYSSQTQEGGWSSWQTNIIPSSTRNNFAYVMRMDFGARLYDYRSGVGGDDDGGYGLQEHRARIRIYYATEAPSFGGSEIDLTLTDLQKHGVYEGGDVYTVPEGRVVVGFQYRTYWNVSGDDDIGVGTFRFQWQIYTMRVEGVSRSHSLNHGSQSYNAYNDTEAFNEWTASYGDTLGGNHFLTGARMNAYANITHDDDGIGNNDIITQLRNYYRPGWITQ